jgi:signal peptidase I
MWWRKIVRVLIWVALICGVLAGIVLAFFEPWTVPGDDAQFAVSIEPTIGVGDVLLVTRASSASDGALVRCTDPDAPGRWVVGRVIGRTGDTVAFSKGSMYIGGKIPTASLACDPPVVRLKNPATQEDEDFQCGLEEFAGSTHAALRSSSVSGVMRDSTAQVEPGKIYLVSDNRILHLDSRDYGAVAPGTCQHIVLRFWGTTGWGDARKRLTVLW